MKFKKKRILHNSYHELAYLHPNNFSPDEKIVRDYGLIPKEYIILRKSALKATHDYGAKGLNDKIIEQINILAKNYTIIKSNELKGSSKIQPWDMHHVMAFAKMIISDSQTMSAEAMVMGVPSVRVNTFVGKLSYLDELENKYGLGFGILPENESEAINSIEYILSNSDIEKQWQKKREKMLSEKCDLTEWMIDFFKKPDKSIKL